LIIYNQILYYLYNIILFIIYLYIAICNKIIEIRLYIN